MKLFVWKNGNEDYDYQAYACVFASSIEEAWDILEGIDEISIDKLAVMKKTKPEIHTKANGFIMHEAQKKRPCYLDFSYEEEYKYL